MGLVYLLVLLMTFIAYAEGVSFKIKRRYETLDVLIKVMGGELSMSWVRLEEGGYMVVGTVPDKLVYEGFMCNFLTDLSPYEIAERVREEGRAPYRLEVRSINGVVEVNRGVYLSEPFNPSLNPTSVMNKEELLKTAQEELLRLVREDRDVREEYRRLYKSAIREHGLSERDAKLFALESLLPRVRIRRWVPEGRLPKKLHLYCRREKLELKNLLTPTGRGLIEIRLYPVRLSVKRQGEIKVLNVEVLERDIRVVFEIAYRGTAPRDVPLDLITLDPPEAKGFDFRGYKRVYVGGYLYYGFGREANRGEYIIHLSGYGDGFYTVLSHQAHTNRYELYIRLGYYGSNGERREISLWNPAEGDAYYTNTLIDAGYTHRKFLRALGLNPPVMFTFRIVSPEGYSSEPFRVWIR